VPHQSQPFSDAPPEVSKPVLGALATLPVSSKAPNFSPRTYWLDGPVLIDRCQAGGGAHGDGFLVPASADPLGPTRSRSPASHIHACWLPPWAAKLCPLLFATDSFGLDLHESERNAETVMSDWTEFGVREGMSISARSPVRESPEVAEFFGAFLAENDAALAEPFRGVTTDGAIAARDRVRTEMPSEAIREAAAGFLNLLDAPTRSRVSFAFESNQWRAWYNPHINVYRHGVMLEELSTPQRNAFLDVLRVTLSTRGYAQARDIMRLNDLLAEVTRRADDYGEWPYFVSFFGVPAADAPWGFQFDGHHLAINCVVVGNQVAMTPMFMGSEPCGGRAGRFTGIRVLDVEERIGLDLIRSLDTDQQQVAIQYASIMPDAIPSHLRHPVDNLTQTGAFRDNAVVPYRGIRADSFSDAQRARLAEAIMAYVGWASDAYATVKKGEVARTLDETWFAWMGGAGPTDAFYYRLHSPVVLIEFEHLPGVAFDNPEPSRHHIHTIMRTPNGGDYGADLLAEHHERFDHQASSQA
jgi:hypothetical protein